MEDSTCQRRRFEEMDRGGMCADERRCAQPEWGNEESKLFVLSQVDMVTQHAQQHRKLNKKLRGNTRQCALVQCLVAPLFRSLPGILSTPRNPHPITHTHTHTHTAHARPAFKRTFHRGT